MIQCSVTISWLRVRSRSTFLFLSLDHIISPSFCLRISRVPAHSIIPFVRCMNFLADYRRQAMDTYTYSVRLCITVNLSGKFLCIGEYVWNSFSDTGSVGIFFGFSACEHLNFNSMASKTNISLLSLSCNYFQPFSFTWHIKTKSKKQNKTWKIVVIAVTAKWSDHYVWLDIKSANTHTHIYVSLYQPQRNNSFYSVQINFMN